MPGLLLRTEARRALDAGTLPTVREVPTCQREETIGTAQARLIESRDGMVLILDRPEEGTVVGLLTLHDLLRAQDTLAQQADSP